MRAGKRTTKTKRLPNVSFRISHRAKEAIQRRAEMRSVAENREVRPGEIAREALEYGLEILAGQHQPPDAEELVDDVMASALFSRRALELLLHEHREMSEKLLRACRADVKRRKHGRRLLGGSG